MGTLKASPSISSPDWSDGLPAPGCVYLESHLVLAAAAVVPATNQVDLPAQRHSGRQVAGIWPETLRAWSTGVKHGWCKAQNISEGYQVPVRRLGRVCTAASSHANVSGLVANKRTKQDKTRTNVLFSWDSCDCNELQSRFIHHVRSKLLSALWQ